MTQQWRKNVDWITWQDGTDKKRKKFSKRKIVEQANMELEQARGKKRR